MSAARRVRAELWKFATQRSLWILPLVTIALTWSLTYVAGLAELQASGGDLSITSADNPMLAVDHLAPAEYQGFDMMNIGLITMIALGAVYAGSEYRNGLLRSSLLADPRRGALFAARVGVLTAVIAVTAFLSMGFGTVLRQIALGPAGIGPFLLPPIVWRNIAGVALTWIVVGLLAYGIGVVARTAIVPLVVTVPLAVGLGDFLITLWAPARYLPPAAGVGLFSELDPTHLGPVAGGITMALWGVAAAVLAGVVFVRRDA